MTPDVLVLGAGPAGAVASIALRRLGVSVTLADPAVRAPRRPRHTESLHPGIEPLLAHLGVVDCLHAATRARYPGVWVEWGSSRRFQPFDQETWEGFHVSRPRLDAGLVAAAAALGTELLAEAPRAMGGEMSGQDGRPEEIVFSSCRLRPRLVIDCTGSNRWLGRRVAADYQTLSLRLFADYGFAGGAAPTELPLVRATEAGWYWLADVGEGLFHWTRVHTHTEYIKNAPIPAELGALVVHSRGAAEVTWYQASRVFGPGWLLCGDAAARLDPVIGGGVLRSIAGAMKAAEAAVAGDPESYQRWQEARVQADIEAVSELYRAAGLSGWLRPAEDFTA